MAPPRKGSKERKERRALVHYVRATCRDRYISLCLAVSYRIIPCCRSCAFNIDGRCYAPQFPAAPLPHNVEWLTVDDADNLCMQWTPSAAAAARAFYYQSQPQSKA